jgi:hypothetical protein
VRSLLEDILPSAGRLGRPVPAPASTPTAPSRGEAANREEMVEELKKAMREIIEELRAS